MTADYELTIKSGEDTGNILSRVHTVAAVNQGSLPELKLQLPLTYEGPSDEEGNVLNYTPEHYFVAAVAGCFFTTFSVVAKRSGIDYISLTLNAKGHMDDSTGQVMMEKIENTITLVIPPNINAKKAERVLKATERNCPLARSVKSEVINVYHVITQEK